MNIAEMALKPISKWRVATYGIPHYGVYITRFNKCWETLDNFIKDADEDDPEFYSDLTVLRGELFWAQEALMTSMQMCWTAVECFLEEGRLDHGLGLPGSPWDEDEEE